MNRCIFRSISPIIVSNFNKFLPVVSHTFELFGCTKHRLSRYLRNGGWTYNANPFVNSYSVHHACFPFPAPPVQGRPPRRGKWGGVPSQLMFCARHDQAPNQKHGIEDTPRDCTRDASYIFGLWLKNWSFFAQSSNTQDCVRSRILSGFPAPRSLRPCLRRSSGVPPSRPTPAHEARIQILRVSGRWMVPTGSGKEQSAPQRSSTASPQPPGDVHPTWRRRCSASSWETKRRNSTTNLRIGQSRTQLEVPHFFLRWRDVATVCAVMSRFLGKRVALRVRSSL